jgi:signal transduction histidine kinase/CHASE3 domain sensor protein
VHDRAASLTLRLWAGLAAFVLLIISGGLLIYAGARHEDQAVDRVVRQLQPLQVANLQIRADFANSQSVLRAYIITRESRFLRLFRDDQATLTHTLRHAAALASGPDHTDVQAQQRAANTWFGYGLRMVSVPLGSPQLTRLTNQAYSYANAFYQTNQKLFTRLQRASTHSITSGQRAVDAAASVGGVLALIAVLLALLAAMTTVRGVTRPLHTLSSVLRRLTAGEHTARAAPGGPAEIVDVATSLNALADEADRLREQEEDSNRLRAMAREAGNRIREHLRVEDLVREAKDALEASLGADLTYLHVRQGGQLGLPVGHEHDWVMPPSFLETLRRGESRFLDMFREHRSLIVQDVADSDAITPRVREVLGQAGIKSQMVVPFGAGTEMLGLIVAARTTSGRQWSRAEVDAIESIAADVGRGLHHARLYEAENRLVTELKAVDTAKSDFLATVSHELRTPLTSIAGYIELLRDPETGPVTGVQDRMLEAVHRNTTRLRHLIEDVLTLSKIESGVFKTSKQPVNMADLITSAVASLQPVVSTKGLTIGSDYPTEGLMVSGDPEQLDRLIMNLLSNAVKFTPEGGRVEVRGEVAEAMAVLRVSDTGIGIPARDQNELFSRFFRASNAVERSIPGTGLGLAIVRTIVANHSGDLDVRSDERDGTTVTVRIPLLENGGPPAPVPDIPFFGEGRP